MRLLIKVVLILVALAGVSAAAYGPIRHYLRQRKKPEFRVTKVEKGDLRVTVNATGTIRPKLSVQIGTFVSGPIIELNADFNDEVKKGHVLALIDPKIYDAAVARDQAGLETRQADVERAKAQLEQARNDEQRARDLFEEDEDFISDAEMDRLRFNRKSLEAQLTVAEASVKQATANLMTSTAQQEYTRITAPCDGMVIDRKIDPGQTLAAQFQTPELFVLGVGMREEMYIYASVDESEIGMIREAQSQDQPVEFRVDAYPGELFEGTIREIRLSSTELQNVVTYPVVVTAENPDLKLLPGMTAYLTFQIEQHDEILKIPWSAVRFFPKLEHVRQEDRHLLKGGEEERKEKEEDDQNVSSDDISAGERVEASRNRLRRHVWVRDGEQLRAVEIRLGINDYRYVEVVEGDLEPDQELVVRLKAGTGG